MAHNDKTIKILNFATHQLHEVILPWWTENMIDERRGGFLGERDHFNRAMPDKPKGIILNARILWAFSAVYRRFRNDAYLRIAERAFTYIHDYFRDSEYQGYVWSLNPDGSLHNGKKQIYAQAFVMYAMAEYSAASGSAVAFKEAADLYELIEGMAFDQKKNGYVEAFSRDWKEIPDLRLSDIDMNEKKTMNTHLHVIEAYSRLYRLEKTDRLRKSVLNLLDIFKTRIIDTESHHLRLFFSEDWEVKSGDISFGHDIEASWLLQEAAESTGDPKAADTFRAEALRICNAVLPAIHPEGGLIHESHTTARQNKDELEWWAQAEGIVGFLNAYQNSGDERFLNYAAGLSDYIENYFIDRMNGEWYYRVKWSGEAITSYEKAGFWKCPYHTVRMCLEIMERLGRDE